MEIRSWNWSFASSVPCHEIATSGSGEKLPVYFPGWRRNGPCRSVFPFPQHLTHTQLSWCPKIWTSSMTDILLCPVYRLCSPVPPSPAWFGFLLDLMPTFVLPSPLHDPDTYLPAGLSRLVSGHHCLTWKHSTGHYSKMTEKVNEWNQCIY